MFQRYLSAIGSMSLQDHLDELVTVDLKTDQASIVAKSGYIAQ